MCQNRIPLKVGDGDGYNTSLTPTELDNQCYSAEHSGVSPPQCKATNQNLASEHCCSSQCKRCSHNLKILTWNRFLSIEKFSQMSDPIYQTIYYWFYLQWNLPTRYCFVSIEQDHVLINKWTTCVTWLVKTLLGIYSKLVQYQISLL